MDPKIAKKTQDTLGKLIKKPPLTDKLLSKPPFRFLHDIMTSVIKTTGFMKGLYTEAEMNSDNVKDKDAKIAFLQKAIDMVATVTGLIVMAKPAKIVAGHEPERTNEFLQALASAINSKVDNDLYVKKVLSGGGGESRKEQGDKEERQDREKERTHSSSRKKDEDKHRKEDKERSRDHDKDREKRHRDRDDDGREEKDRERHRDQREKSRDKEERHKNRDRDKDRDKDRGRDRERERRKKNTEGSAREVDKDLSGNAAMSELTSAHNNNPRESHLRSAEDSPPVGAKKSEQERQSLTKAANVHQRPSGDKKHTKKSGIAKELTPSDRLSGPKRSHKAGKNLEASTHQSNLESSLQSPTTSEKETPADSIRFLEKSFHQTSSFPTFPSGLEKQGSVHRKLRDSQQASRSSPPMVKQSSSSALSTVSGAASPKKPSKAPAAKRNRKSSSDSTDTNKASNKLKTELSLPQTNRSARESLHSSDVRSRAGISQDKLNTTITMRTVEEDCEDDILTSTDLVDKLVTNHDGDFKQIVSGSQMASSGASILQLNQSDLLATVQTDKAEISLPQLPVSESSPSLQPGKQIIDLTRKPKAVKLRNNSLRKSRTSSKIPMENHLTQAETGVDSAEIPQGKGSHFPAMGAGEDAGEIEEKSLMVKPSLSHFNLPSESSAKQCSSSTLLDSHHPQKEVEEKENESPGQNGEKDSPQGAPARQQRPTSAKGARRRRQGREAREEDDDEFLQKDNREPAISENDLPPQIAASRKMARPASARPAPPRPKQDGVEAEPAMRLGTGAPTNLIVDDGKQSEDEDENFLVEESAPPPPAAEHVSAQGEVEDDAEHGALVKKMLESKKEAEQQQQPTKKTEIERPALSDTQRRKQRELVAKEIERLQTSIQSLTRSANPLGKIMDYVQEDMDSMQKELDRWRAENKEHALALHRERNVTDRAIEPLKAQLADIDRAISDQLDLIAASKSSIIRNDNRIQKMLLSIARS